MSDMPMVWFNGELVDWGEARLHASSECVLKGTNAFEGIRAYWSSGQEQLHIFRMSAHLDRLTGVSMRMLHLWLADQGWDLGAAILDLLRANRFRQDVHIRPVVYFDTGSTYGDTPETMTTGAFVLALPRGAHAGAERGIRCTVSPWRRPADTAQPVRIKSGANYLNARLAAVDARRKGFDLPLLLNERGHVAESVNACVIMVRDGVVLTPPVTEGILESITRATLLELLAEDLELAPVERPIDLSELYLAEELLLCGTAMEILPVTSIDGYRIGDGHPGSVTMQLQERYQAVVRGEHPERSAWLTPVY